MANENLGNAKKAKNDEFYTQYQDIEREINAYLEYNPDVFRGKTVLLPCDDPEWSNFTKFFAQKFQDLGLGKLISTSFAPDSKPPEIPYHPTLFEIEDKQFDEEKTQSNGKIFTLTKDKTGDGVVNVEDLEWTYLHGDGDFRSDEITKLRDEADIIITNPPFSLFREFLTWLNFQKKDFVIIGNMNAITNKEVFPLIRDNKMWLGATRAGVGSMWFMVPSNSADKLGQKVEKGKKYQTIGNSAWFTTIDHGRRHQDLVLMTEMENRKFSKHPGIRDFGYQEYDNYEAIEVPRVEAIPSDYEGVMGVPITFLGKHNPDQFEILDANDYRKSHQKLKNYALVKDADGSVNGVNKYVRILIRHKKASK